MNKQKSLLNQQILIVFFLKKKSTNSRLQKAYFERNDQIQFDFIIVDRLNCIVQ
jgi:hypothetical protein